MTDQELDVVLQEETGGILPSSGFLLAVMKAVESEAASLPALSFPWKRALPGIIGGLLFLTSALLTILTAQRSPLFWSVNSPKVLVLCDAFANVVRQPASLWFVVATLLGTICIAGSRRPRSVR